jgi:diguanylate cyclase (GGDEF)-like protein/PAS domain S-box-containing protein
MGDKDIKGLFQSSEILPSAFLTASSQYNAKIMKWILAVFIFLDTAYLLSLCVAPAGFWGQKIPGLIPIVILVGFVLLIWMIVKKNDVTPLYEYLFVTYILGSRLLYGNLIGFQTSVIAVYVGSMLLLSTLFCFSRRVLYTILVLQVILHVEAFFGIFDQNVWITLLITDVFAITSVILGLDRYRNKQYGKGIIEKNNELNLAYQRISHYSQLVEEQLKRTSQAESLMNGVLKNMESALVLLDTSGDLKYYNDGLRGITGYGFEELTEKVLFQIISEADLEKFDQAIMDVGRTKGSSVLQKVAGWHRDGSTRTARVRFDYLDIGGEGHILVAITDITNEMEQQEQLAQLSKMKDVVLAINHHLSEDAELVDFFDYVLSRVREIMPYADLGCILMLDEAGDLTMASSFGYLQEENENFKLPLKESFAYRCSGGDYSRTVIINNIQTLLNPDYVDIMDNHEGYLVQSSISGPIYKDNKLYGLLNIDSRYNNIFVENDITIMEYLREQLGIALSHREMFRQYAYLSKHDQLTGFLNRWYLEELVTDHVPRWRRYDTDILLVTMDLNNLKKVNDHLGHHKGDQYILTFSKAIQYVFRTTDIFLRMGGDEFAGFCFEINEAGLVHKLEEVNQIIGDSDIQKMALSIPLGFSYGIVKFGEESFSIETQMKKADEKMYQYKMALKNHYDLISQ